MAPQLKPVAVREAIEERVLADLHGPKNGPHEELLRPTPLDQYILGLLAPKRAPRNISDAAAEPASATNDSADDDDGAVVIELPEEPLALGGSRPSADEDSSDDSDMPAANQLVPSALGLTVALDPAATQLRVKATWGRYVAGPSDEFVTETGQPRTVRKREPAGGAFTIPIGPDGSIDAIVPDRDQREVVVTGLVRTRGEGDGQVRLVSIFLRNEQREGEKRDEGLWLFQAALELSDPEGKPIFAPRGLPSATHAPEVDRDELAGLDMLYRRTVEFAVGHGTGVAATRSADDPRRAMKVRSCAAPTAEVPITEAPGPDDFASEPSIGEPFAEAARALDMRWLGELPADQLQGALRPLVVAYRAWIERQRERISDPEELLGDHQVAADRHLSACETAADRIDTGIETLADPDVARAFQLANRAMWKQRVHTIAAENRRENDALRLRQAVEAADEPRNRSWRPFQLAFVLLNLPSIADPLHEERSASRGLLDLLFFPTGGGKTEAYLGLTAFTIGLRRLRGTAEQQHGDGVSVLMRYTLRLLTLQQFQRAAALICACELERRRDPETWGATPFRLGLWVGANSTPNKTEKAADWLSQARRQGGKQSSSGGSPLQLKRCPWCGDELGIAYDSLEIDQLAGATRLYCPDDTGACPFTRAGSPSQGIPAVVVDEEIYQRLPALVIATVDKFARMPWEGRTQALFGKVDRLCPRHGYITGADPEHAATHTAGKGLPKASVKDLAGPLLPPDLIIQDELHLISGPLGTLVGLYETAIDELCGRTIDGVRARPKVIASTATIRRAGQQVRRVFGRDLEVFPPPGLDARDNFFSVQRDAEGGPAGRQYIGICAPGRRFKQVLIRTYLAQLTAAWELGRTQEAADAYMTLVGYFNSLRELGGMRRLVDDDVQNRLGDATRESGPRRNLVVEELTSRLSSDRIPKVLDQLGTQFVYPKIDANGKPIRPPQGTPRWIDVLLATNMISVGVDVPRLGAMVVAGQPKTTSEYIQATSRVGRRAPGIVFTVYAWSKPRDLSHYERFTHYHDTFYREVEALSVTPFSARALDRGIAGVLASLVRLGGPESADNRSAAKVALMGNDVAALIEAVVQSAGSKGDARAEAMTRERLETKRDAWDREQHVPQRTLGYEQKSKSGDVVGLLETPGAVGWHTWTVANSLRDVEAGAGLSLRKGAISEPDEPWDYGQSQDADV